MSEPEKAPRVNLLDLDPQGMDEFFLTLGEKPYRTKQVMQWIYQHGVSDFAQMTNLRKDLRALLGEIAEVRPPEVVGEQVSKDGTIKWALGVGEGELVEMVLIPERGRNTLCISTQVGCPVRCSFCRTGAMGFRRNLRVSEIVGQVYLACARVGFPRAGEEKAISNVVMMGMGEPLLNLEAVVKSVQVLLCDNAFALSKRHVTISTAGVAPAINKLVGRVDVALALSLHAANDSLRDTLVPLNRKFPIHEVLAAVRHYLANSNANCGKATIEYALLGGVNDRLEDARALARLLGNLPCKINLIPYNPHDCAGYERPSAQSVAQFSELLQRKGYTVMVRATRGDDISAACGMLAGKMAR